MPEGRFTEIEFVDATVGMNIPKNFIPSIEKVTDLNITCTLTLSYDITKQGCKRNLLPWVGPCCGGRSWLLFGYFVFKSTTVSRFDRDCTKCVPYCLGVAKLNRSGKAEILPPPLRHFSNDPSLSWAVGVPCPLFPVPSSLLKPPVFSSSLVPIHH